MMFRKETEFQETEIGKIPKDWKLVKLSNIAEDIYYGITAKAVEHKTGLKMLRTTDIKDYNVDWDSLPFCEITEKRGNIQRFLLKKGDIIIARAGTTGVCVLVEKDLGDVIFGSYLIKVRLNKNVYPRFIYYFCQSRFYWNQITSGQAGSTIKNINLPLLKSLNIPLPPLEEQKRIADVLLAVDSGIGTVDRAVAKLERMKRTLLNELLTGRIRVREENGKLTFYKETEFQETEIGEMPKDWYVKRLKEVADFQRGFSYRSDEKFAEEIPDGYLFLTLNSVKEGGGLKEDGWTWIKSDRLGERRFIREGDLVIANTEQSKDGSLIGSPAIVHFPEWYKKDKAVFSHHISRLLLKINNIDVNFLFYYLSFVQPIARKYHTGTGVWGLDVDKWSTDLLIPLPPIKEQTAIAEILSTVDKAIELYRKEKERLLRLRRGLMSVLLTGRVRVIGDVKNVGVVT